VITRTADASQAARARARMVERLRTQGIRDERVLAAMQAVPRHAFVEEGLAFSAYDDTPLPIGFQQTISQPYVVARTAELMLAGVPDPRSARVLEIGTGCGYAAAVLAHIFKDVVSIERIRALHERARANLRELRLPNLRLVCGDGSVGVAAAAPYDAIAAAAAGDAVPPAWIEQLKPGGCIVAPVGSAEQTLAVVAKGLDGRITRRDIEAVRFVPLRGGVQ